MLGAKRAGEIKSRSPFSADRNRRADEITWTDDNLLRQVMYEGLREDKPAAEVRRPLPHPSPSRMRKKSTSLARHWGKIRAA